jgi:DNA-binding Xre family transcriptional regulator
MRICYDKLWSLLKRNKMKRKDLMAAADITEYTLRKLNRDEAVSLDVVARICKVFHCDIGDIVEMIEE